MMAQKIEAIRRILFKTPLRGARTEGDRISLPTPCHNSTQASQADPVRRRLPSPHTGK